MTTTKPKDPLAAYLSSIRAEVRARTRDAINAGRVPDFIQELTDALNGGTDTPVTIAALGFLAQQQRSPAE